jgi:ketosteroid isomerase-like protein
MKIKILSILTICLATAAHAQSSPREQLELAERDFQRATLEKGVEGWNSFFADSGAQLQNTSRIVRGHAAIKELMGEFLASKTDRLIWWPVSSEVSASGDMAYTFGASGVVSADSTGHLVIQGRGTYLTVWRKQPEGRWLVTADMGGQANPRAVLRRDSVLEREVLSVESARAAAIADKNRAALETIYSYDFLGVSDGAVVPRDGFLSRIIGNSDQSVKYTTRDVSASVLGVSAVVTGVLEANRAGTRVVPTSFLHIYVFRDGRWVFVRGLSRPMSK